jgi:hypothetical protein
MKDNILELRINNFMKVNFDIIKAREDHNLCLRKSRNEEMINSKRCLPKKETADPSDLEIDQMNLNIDTTLKNYKVIEMVNNQ